MVEQVGATRCLKHISRHTFRHTLRRILLQAWRCWFEGTERFRTVQNGSERFRGNAEILKNAFFCRLGQVPQLVLLVLGFLRNALSTFFGNRVRATRRTTPAAAQKRPPSKSWKSWTIWGSRARLTVGPTRAN